MMQLLSVLANNLWEGAVIALAAWIALRIARDVNATTRYVVWTCALAATVILPVFTGFIIARPQTPQASISAPQTYSAPAIHESRLKMTPVAGSAHDSAPSGDSKSAVPARRVVFVPQWIVWGILGVWALIGLVQVVRFIFGIVALERLKHNATPLAIEYRRNLPRWNAAEAAREGVRLCVSDEISVPVAVGLFDAMILIPEALLEQLPHDDVDRILLHELMHLRRRDDWIHAFQRFVTALCFFNPAVAFIARQMDLEREVSCDDSVVERDGLHPVPYATCLTKMAEIASWPYRPLAAPGVFDTRRSLSIRVERLLNTARGNRTRFAAAPALTAVLVISAAGIAGAAVSSNFSFALPVLCDRPQTYVMARAFAPVQYSLPFGPVTSVAAVKPKPAVKPKTPVKTQPAVTETTVKTEPAVKTKVGVKTQRRVAAKPRVARKSIVRVDSASDPSDDYIQELASEGYSGLSINELVQLRSVGVDREYIRAIEAAGFPHPPARELMQLRATGVTPQVITELRQRLGALSLRQISEMHAVGVTGDYIDSLARAGFHDITPGEVTQMRALGVTPDIIATLRSRLPSVTLRQLVQLHAVGVDPDYIDSLARAGYSGLSAQQLTQLRALGVDAEYISKVHAHGFNNVTVQQLIEIKATGLL